MSRLSTSSGLDPMLEKPFSLEALNRAIAMLIAAAEADAVRPRQQNGH